MRPVALNSVAFSDHDLSNTPPVKGAANPSPIHYLRDIDLKTLEKPYTNDHIKAYLNEHKVAKTGEPIFDDCIFQSVLFTDFFDKIETGFFETSDPKIKAEYDRTAGYLLKKSVELLQPLGKKIDETRQRFDGMLKDVRENPAANPHIIKSWLKEELPFVQGMVERFEALENSLLNAWADPGSFKPSREKACFLLFVHAMLSDTADQIQGLMESFQRASSDFLMWEMPREEERGMIEHYLTYEEPPSELFSSDPLTKLDAELQKKCMNQALGLFSMEKSAIPSFSPKGSQGVLAILHAIFHGKILLSAAAGRVSAVHDGSYMERHFSTLRHDCDHLEVLLVSKTLSSTAKKLIPLYQKLTDPQSNASPLQVKRDLVVLFHMLHENTPLMMMLRRPSDSDANKSFLDLAQAFLNSYFNVVDTVTLLNKVEEFIVPIDKESSRKEVKACYEAVANAMNSLWMDFRVRHAVDLKESGLFEKLPNFLPKSLPD